MHRKIVVLLLLIMKIQSFYSLPCPITNSVDISSGTKEDFGVISHEGFKYNNNEYFIENSTGLERGCICLKRKCVLKCCPAGSSYDASQKVPVCVDEQSEFTPPIYSSYNSLSGDKFVDLFNVVYGKVNCSKGKNRIPVDKLSDNYRLIKDGRLWIEMPDKNPPSEFKDPDEYCIDTFVQEDANGVRTSQLNALVCFGADPEIHHFVLSASCMLVSCFFIILTLAVYIWLPELRNLHGKVLMGYLITLLVAFVLVATLQLIITDNKDLLELGLCKFFTFVPYYFLEAAFFWMNVMCFDIYYTFCGNRGVPMERSSTQRKFRNYCIYALGMPLVLTILLVILEYSNQGRIPYLPTLDVHGCFLYGRDKMIYLYGPIGILYVVNLVFFLLTIKKIADINRETAANITKNKESATNDSRRNDKQRLFLYVKLFCVMGINWILEIISFCFPHLSNFFMYTDAYNVLTGVIIFIIFVCKKKIFRLMKKRYNQARGMSDISRTHTSSTRTLGSRKEVRMNFVQNKIN